MGALTSGLSAIGTPTASDGVVIALAVTAHVLLGLLIRRKVTRDRRRLADGTASGRWLPWIDAALERVVAPVTFLIWTVTVTAVLWPSGTASPSGPDVARLVLGLSQVGLIGGFCWLLHSVGRVIEAATIAIASQHTDGRRQVILPVAGAAARLLLPWLGLIVGARLVMLPDAVARPLNTVFTMVLIGTTAFLIYRCIEGGEALILRRYRLDVEDNLEARTVYTQVVVLKKIATAAVVVFAAASMLMVFESVRQFGTSILASAGIAGIIIGFAAQRSIATLVAGFQIALTQPIRLDDVVIVEGEWGRIEDITLTYVVVQIWDERRLIVPITQFIEQPFQNWTRTSSSILGTVFLHVDYRAPLEELRRELTRILVASPHWNGKVNVLQVTDATSHTLELRALASADDASRAWDLRCEVREKLVGFIQREHPDSLPRMRGELDTATAASRM